MSCLSRPPMFLPQQRGSSITSLRWQTPCSSDASVGDLNFQLELLHKKGSNRLQTPQQEGWMLKHLDTF